MRADSILHLDDLEACVDATLSRIGKSIVLGLPVGIGKPNTLVNAFVRRALADKSIRLTIFTALSLRAPRGRSDLERRFLQPFVQRVFGDYPEPEYMRLLETGALPANIEINEFFMEPGAWLRNERQQRSYVSSNYTHVARDLIRRGVNVIAQLIVPAAQGDTVSLSCNPDLTVDLLTHIEAERDAGRPFVLIGHVHRQLPYMFGDAEVPRSTFDIVLDTGPEPFPLFCPPNMPIGTTDYAIGLHVAALMRDGGAVQVGIGELGDAIVYGVKLRHEHSTEFAKLLTAAQVLPTHAALIEHEGGIAPFTRGLYGCSEMLVDGFIDLFRAGILKRRVYPHALLQTLLNSQRIDETVSADTLLALHEAGLGFITARDFAELQSAGVFRDEVSYVNGKLVCADGESITADLHNATARRKIAKSCLGSALRNGVLLHGGFFFGPKAFYAALRELPEAERRQFAMQRISFVNELYGDQQDLKIAQRQYARFVNTTMMVTALGAAVSDGLEDGRVVSGVGGQYNFVAMAHALPNARSILCLRSTRTVNGRTTSNIVWNYGHVTIPRHLRDIVISEYGIADLRGRSDSETIAALIDIADARFQDDLVAAAKRNGKLAANYRIPDRARLNTPQRLNDMLRPYRAKGWFGELPFGGDFTAEELVIAKALKRLQADTTRVPSRLNTMARALIASTPDAALERFLRRLNLHEPRSFKERILQRMVANALQSVLGAAP